MTLDAILTSPYFNLIIGGFAAYYGAMRGISERLIRIEMKHEALEKRFDSDHMKLEEHLDEKH